MSDNVSRKPIAGKVVIGILLLMVAGSLLGARRYKQIVAAQTSNYKVSHIPPRGWVPEPHGTLTLFLYRDKATNILLRGAHNQIYDDANPSPELDTNNIAKFYIDRTHDNMKDWTAEFVGNKKGKDCEFAIIRRECKDKTVVCAFSVKGNTTLIVSLSGNDKEKALIDKKLPVFYEFLSQVSLNLQKPRVDL